MRNYIWMVQTVVCFFSLINSKGARRRNEEQSWKQMSRKGQLREWFDLTLSLNGARRRKKEKKRKRERGKKKIRSKVDAIALAVTVVNFVLWSFSKEQPVFWCLTCIKWVVIKHFQWQFYINPSGQLDWIINRINWWWGKKKKLIDKKNGTCHEESQWGGRSCDEPRV